MSAQMHAKLPIDNAVIEIKSNQPSCCPSCHNTSNFTYIGTQIWPLRVAQKLGIPQQTALWRCEICHTTITK
ncbi:MAG: hypothetical protein SFZ02_00825 [bacterium]|nr:hypothetical protein [bacterium]